MFIKLTVVVVLANRTQLPNVGSCIRKDVTDDDNINDDDDVEGNVLYCNTVLLQEQTKNCKRRQLAAKHLNNINSIVNS